MFLVDGNNVENKINTLRLTNSFMEIDLGRHNYLKLSEGRVDVKGPSVGSVELEGCYDTIKCSSDKLILHECHVDELGFIGNSVDLYDMVTGYVYLQSNGITDADSILKINIKTDRDTFGYTFLTSVSFANILITDGVQEIKINKWFGTCILCIMKMGEGTLTATIRDRDEVDLYSVSGRMEEFTECAESKLIVDDYVRKDFTMTDIVDTDVVVFGKRVNMSVPIEVLWA